MEILAGIIFIIFMSIVATILSVSLEKLFEALFQKPETPIERCKYCHEIITKNNQSSVVGYCDVCEKYKDG